MIGTVWGAWHLPAFYLGGTVQSSWNFMPFFIGSVAIGVIMTALFNDARGSILLPMVLHFQLNNPLWPDAQPYDTFLFAGVAIVVVWIKWNSMFSREWAITEVVPRQLEPRLRVSPTG